ncbi:MAG: hypothetical protein PHS59_02585 [Paludibacter sp.]|nr:hypothetical protein [Paludibacter sp.]
MPKEDYLLKYLEKLSRVIAAMIGLREKGFLDDSIKLAEETYKELLDLDIDKLLKMPVSEFSVLLKTTGYSAKYLEALAELTTELANSFMILKNEQAQNIYTKALEIYSLLNEKDKTFSFERETKISKLKELINK